MKNAPKPNAGPSNVPSVSLNCLDGKGVKNATGDTVSGGVLSVPSRSSSSSHNNRFSSQKVTDVTP